MQVGVKFMAEYSASILYNTGNVFQTSVSIRLCQARQGQVQMLKDVNHLCMVKCDSIPVDVALAIA